MARAQYTTLDAEMLVEGQIFPKGSLVNYDGVPDKNLKPMNAKAESNMKAAEAIRKDKELDADERAEQLRDLDDKLMGIGEYQDADDDADEKEDPALVKQAVAAAEAEEQKQLEDGNYTRVKLQGDNNPAPAAKQAGSSKK